VPTYRAFQESGSRPSAIRLGLSARVSFWVMIVAYLGLMFAASAPSPLYVVYQARWHFSAITLTSIFGVYALALLLTLLTVGGLSDFVGRKPVLLAGFVSLAASMVVFARADGVGWLYLARVLQGLAAGSSLGALSAGIVDFAGPKRQRFAGVVNSLVPSLGLALGALGAGGLVQFAPAPTVLVFVVLGALFALVLLAVAAGPETERSRGGALRSLTPRMRVPRRLRPEFIRTMPALFATWAQVGFTLSLTTTLAAVRFGLADRFLDALVVAAVCGSASLATIVMRNAPARRSTVLGCVALVIGSGITLVSLAGPWTIAFYAGSVLTGLGLGATLGAAMRTLSLLPAHSERGEFFASVYVVGYLAFSVPAIIAGICVVHAGLVKTTIGYGVGISLLALVAAANALRPARRGASDRAQGQDDRTLAGADGERRRGELLGEKLLDPAV
jgi:MFS family permease